MSVEHFRTTFLYDSWAIHQVFQALSNAATPPEAALHTLAHVIMAKKIWWLRLTGVNGGNTTGMNAFPKLSLRECEALMQEVEAMWEGCMGSLTEEKVSTEIPYTTTEGGPRRSPAKDILTHVTHHSMYHRGQIAKTLREAGIDPPVTDFIVYSLKKRAGKI